MQAVQRLVRRILQWICLHARNAVDADAAAAPATNDALQTLLSQPSRIAILWQHSCGLHTLVDFRAVLAVVVADVAHAVLLLRRLDSRLDVVIPLADALVVREGGLRRRRRVEGETFLGIFDRDYIFVEGQETVHCES